MNRTKMPIRGHHGTDYVPIENHANALCSQATGLIHRYRLISLDSLVQYYSKK